MLTSCLSSILHIWSVCPLQIAELVATEFFEQGDKEREELNIEPIVSSLPAHYITPSKQQGDVKSSVGFHDF